MLLSSFYRWTVLGLLAICSLTGAFLLRFDLTISPGETVLLARSLCLAVPIKFLMFYLFGVQVSGRRFPDMSDVRRIVYGNALGALASGFLLRLVLGSAFPRSVYLIDFLLCLLLTAALRFVPVMWNDWRHVHQSRESGSERKLVLIYGAGEAGSAFLRGLRTQPELGYQAIGFLDDDLRLRKLSVADVPVLGRGRDAASIVSRLRKQGKEIHAIIIAVAAPSGRECNDIIANCRSANVAYKIIPGVAELISGETITKVRNVSVGDLLARVPVHLDEADIRADIEGKSIMVTGAAGSIGSELCRQLARFKPSCLAIFDQSESELFNVDYDLRARFPELNICCQLGDIRDQSRIEDALDESKPVVIYHAAAYKHVPMMESHLLEAVRNNVLGTWNLVSAMRRKGIHNIVMISSDKAVNPTSLMGATKRVCELIVAAAGADTAAARRFVSVRFGNVLGSNGSVVHTFQKQIAAGGPIRVTHPEMRRYFMTIPEAVMLVLQAATMGKGSQIFVLEMGEPVTIVDLARNLIRLAGLVPEKDIEIQFTGLRPGEKLFEEIKLDGENILPTYHEKIRILSDAPVRWSEMNARLMNLRRSVDAHARADILRWLCETVPEYAPKALPQMTIAVGKGALLEGVLIHPPQENECSSDPGVKPPAAVPRMVELPPETSGTSAGTRHRVRC